VYRESDRERQRASQRERARERKRRKTACASMKKVAGVYKESDREMKESGTERARETEWERGRGERPRVPQ